MHPVFVFPFSDVTIDIGCKELVVKFPFPSGSKKVSKVFPNKALFPLRKMTCVICGAESRTMSSALNEFLHLFSHAAEN